MENSKTDYYGITSIIFGVLSWVVLGIVFAPIGLIFGIIGINKNKGEQALSVIGIVLNLISLLIMVIAIAMVR